MKKKALVLAVGLAFATPTISVANILPSNFVGLSLGEVQPQSYLNEPFRGIIPILFTDIDSSKNLTVKLAPESIFQDIGAEKLPILNSLKFHVDVKNNKPIIYISSDQPIQMPFLNFVLEIKGPQGSVYQDYTTLLDPKGSAVNAFAPNLQTFKQKKVSLRTSITTSASALIDANRTLKVKSGDTLSQIAQALNAADVSLKKMVTAIHQRNPNAFINNNINRLKAGAVLHIPTTDELTNSSFKIAAKVALKDKPSNFNKVTVTSESETYTIKRGDSLSKITKSIGHKNVSFTRMMKAIHSANPHAFSKNRINLLKVGKVLRIPAIEEVVSKDIQSNKPNNEAANIKTADSSNAQQENNDNAKEFVLDGFIVESGDTLAKITKQIGHEGIPYSEMMHAIYKANPDAFEKNNITTLIEGSLIRLPSIAEIKEMNSKVIKEKPNRNLEKPIKSKNTHPIEIENNNQESKSKGAVLNKLEKRVRELKRDLSKAHSNLSDLALSLTGKEQLVKQQSRDLAKLASTLELLNNDDYKQASADVNKKDKDEFQSIVPELVEPVNNETISPTNNSPKVDINPTSAEPKMLESDILLATRTSYMPQELSQTLFSNVKNKLAEYSQYMSGKELFASILALLFGLALIRYRREIYAYTNISYDYPKYYPPFGEEEARKLLKEKSINYHDSLVDIPSSIHAENKPVFSDTQIQECEELADELIEDLGIKTTIHNDSTNWSELDKACDDYIEEFKENSVLEIKDVSDNLIEGAQSEPEEMTFELFEALAEGITNKEPSSILTSVEDDTLIYDLDNESVSSIDPFEDKQPMPFGKLASLTKKTDLEKTQVS